MIAVLAIRTSLSDAEAAETAINDSPALRR
jgi:hypothetical protein